MKSIYENWIFIVLRKILTVNSIEKKLNNQVAEVDDDISDEHTVSMMKYLASMMLLGVVAFLFRNISPISLLPSETRQQCSGYKSKIDNNLNEDDNSDW